ncbi:cartilage intermediate layer protein 1 [Thalassophryne amazonica]|uniref:cartilage intermediate layer protein 1 n=1 Tax=Thalassophryne amazonica TaxID=390379 RepID=UPI001470EB97|nr:cartilage intermediate layer protein 1 [Thalassophryne amazonica]
MSFFVSDTTVGFVCRKDDQKDKTCSDYRVRFRCPSSFCVCWSNWFDRDDPSGTGDWEDLTNLKKENNGKICDTPVQIEAVTTDTSTPATLTGQTFEKYSPTEGLVCLNKAQKNSICRDYKVRFGCPCPGTTII